MLWVWVITQVAISGISKLPNGKQLYQMVVLCCVILWFGEHPFTLYASCPFVRVIIIGDVQLQSRNEIYWRFSEGIPTWMSQEVSKLLENGL